MTSAVAKQNVLDDSEREQLRRLIADCHGLASAAKRLDVSRGVLSSVLAGISVRRGSLEQVRAALAAARGDAK